MQIRVFDPVFQTIIFAAIFIAALLLSTKFIKREGFTQSVTDELKGFAILAIVFSHIGYFLSKDNQFLYPLSALAGVGVNIFLFLSGFGLTKSTLKNIGVQTRLEFIKNFYKKRLIKLFPLLWLVLIIFLVLDLFVLNIHYPFKETVLNFFGLSPTSDIFGTIDSPLWYFSLILYYYLIFPFFFIKKRVGLSAVLLGLFTFFVLQFKLPIDHGVGLLYRLHFIAFPLGVAFTLFDQKLLDILDHKLKHFLLPILLLILGFLTINSGVGAGDFVEEAFSIIILFVILLIFIIMPVRFRLFSLFGIFSYEIYLIHWPILYRYGYLYKFLPAWLSTCLYLAIFLVVGFIFQKIISTKVLKKLLAFKS
jgi:peptidoglycan/LPS O-acetylase OafA/YrhL